jgi:hypothetical protein
MVRDPGRVLLDQWHGGCTSPVSLWTRLLKYLSQPLAGRVDHRKITLVFGGIIIAGALPIAIAEERFTKRPHVTESQGHTLAVRRIASGGGIANEGDAVGVRMLDPVFIAGKDASGPMQRREPS